MIVLLRFGVYQEHKEDTSLDPFVIGTYLSHMKYKKFHHPYHLHEIHQLNNLHTLSLPLSPTGINYTMRYLVLTFDHLDRLYRSLAQIW